MGVPASATEQSPEETHRLLYVSVVHRRPIAALYDGTRRLLCPHVLGMSRGIRQTLHICRKALLLWAWRGRCTHKTILYQNVYVYNTVVLGACGKNGFSEMSPATFVQKQS